MIGFFPDPHPDELLYSACARFGDRVDFPNVRSVIGELFGSEKFAAVIDLPSRLNYLCTVFPPKHKYSADSFIFDNTLFPFYAPFLPLERIQLLLQDMKGTGSNHVRERLGITAGRLPLPEQLRFCPICVKDDLKKYRETYWHRIHQITGVEVCPYHKVFLEMSRAPWRGHRHSSEFISAQSSVYDTTPRRLKAANAHHSILLKIAVEAAWLLKWRGPGPGAKELRARYYNILLENGYAYYNGRIRTTKLLKAFVEFYSQNLLLRLQCPVNSTIHSWVIRLLVNDKVTVAQPPLHHILLMIFLDHTAKQIFTSFAEYKPFGAGPWPCLNHASEHFGESVVTDSSVTDNLEKSGKPLGTFSCTCGFVYNRTGPDRSEEDRLRYSSVQSYGPIWEKSLRKLWGNTSISLGEAARRLGVSELTVVRHAIRLDLPRNTSGTRKVNGYERHKNHRPTRQHMLETYRRDWMTVLKANPDASRKRLIEIASFLYLWLKKNDSEWIETHLPPPRKPNRRVSHINWKPIDRELSIAIRASALHIKQLPGRPVRASITAIIKDVGHQAWIEKKLDKLPHTAKAIAKHVESLEDYTIRKVRWAENWYRQEGICPTRLQLMVRACVRNKTGRTPPVQKVIDTALEKLRLLESTNRGA